MQAAEGARAFTGPILGGVCDWCRGPLNGSGRGSPQRFCRTACRRSFEAEARRVGAKALRRQKAAGSSRPKRVACRPVTERMWRATLALLAEPC
jgi:hypothetical protein